MHCGSSSLASAAPKPEKQDSCGDHLRSNRLDGWIEPNQIDPWETFEEGYAQHSRFLKRTDTFAGQDNGEDCDQPRTVPEELGNWEFPAVAEHDPGEDREDDEC
ncbi:MAG: hypothetical protein KJ703_08175, partial [Alphaproteobacteria bacterium]|nr:hypothetical protein [Alphaproteobacteria bacterium]MBU1756946.1 hypothetical protein [Alphaproteobacteria bacterium]